MNRACRVSVLAVCASSIVAASTSTAVFRTTTNSYGLVKYASSQTFDFGGGFASSPASAQNSTGDTVIAGRDSAGGVWMGRFYSGPETFFGWVSGQNGAMVGVLALAGTPSGVTFLAAREASGAYWLNSFSSSNTFSGWIFLGGVFQTDPSIAAKDSDIFITGRDSFGGIWTCRSQPGNQSVQWHYRAGAFIGKPASVIGSDGALYLVARSASNALWVARQEGDQFSGWASIGGVVSQDPDIVATGGLIHIVATSAGNQVWDAKFAEGSPGEGVTWTNTGGVLADAHGGTDGSDLYIGGHNGQTMSWCRRATAAWWTSNTIPSLPTVEAITIGDPPAPPFIFGSCGLTAANTFVIPLADRTVYGYSDSTSTGPHTRTLQASLYRNNGLHSGPFSQSGPK